MFFTGKSPFSAVRALFFDNKESFFDVKKLIFDIKKSGSGSGKPPPAPGTAGFPPGHRRVRAENPPSMADFQPRVCIHKLSPARFTDAVVTAAFLRA
jgi:hypothetical protein